MRFRLIRRMTQNSHHLRLAQIVQILPPKNTIRRSSHVIIIELFEKTGIAKPAMHQNKVKIMKSIPVETSDVLLLREKIPITKQPRKSIPG